MRNSLVATLVAKFCTNKEIAYRLGLAEGTVKIHLHNIYRKLRIRTRTALAVHALRAVPVRRSAYEGVSA